PSRVAQNALPPKQNFSPITQQGTSTQQRERPAKEFAAAKTPSRPSATHLPGSAQRIAREGGPRGFPDAKSFAGRKPRRPERHIVKNQPPRTPAPQTPVLLEEPRTRVARQEYAVDGERPAASDLSNHFVAYGVPSGQNPPAPRTFVMDNIPVTASAARPVSAQS